MHCLNEPGQPPQRDRCAQAIQQLLQRGTMDNTSMVLNIDLASTILGAAGIDQGRDVAASHQEGESFDRDDWCYEFTTSHAGGSTATALIDW